MLKVIADGPMSAGPYLISDRPVLVAYVDRMEKVYSSFE